jgi:16S rRNA (cytosine1402-N4)-methyltransferase
LTRPATYHAPVLVAEVVRALGPRAGGVYVDATVGGGGHAAAVLQATGPTGQLIGLDWDDEAVAASRERLKEFGEQARLVVASYVELEQVLMSVGVTAVDGVLFDLGVSSRQFDEPSRGFSFQHDGPLDMRMSRHLRATAADLLRTASVAELAEIFFRYGEERRARFIARAIDRERQRQPITTTGQLARLCGEKRSRLHPATRVFQALRIAVNRELDNLRAGLVAAVRVLQPGGRVAVISFQSLEDRIVKHFFREQAAAGGLRVLTRKPVEAGAEEVERNPRARSAKLRVAEKN